jgi:hypothetical protein
MQAVHNEWCFLRPEEREPRGSAGKSCFGYAPASFTVTHPGLTSRPAQHMSGRSSLHMTMLGGSVFSCLLADPFHDIIRGA